ncbi:MAG: TIGR02597 family protein [Chthoniobacterales bacterium]
MRKQRSIVLLVATVSTLVFTSVANGQSVTTEPVGFMTDSLLGNSDTFVSLPLIRPPAFVGGIQSAGGTTITVNGNPWTANQFVYAPGTQPNRYYALIGPATAANPKEGHTYPIVSNTANTITVQLGQDNLTGIPANAQLSVIPNWTLATAFPSADQNVSFTPTTSTAQYKTQVRVPDVSASGINLPYADYFFSNNVNGTSGNIGWRRVGDNTIDHGDDALLPDSHIVVRNLNGSPTLPLVNLGGVLTKKFTTSLITNASLQDNPVGILRPLDVALNATGLQIADGSFRAGDRLRLFNNSVAGFDKSPDAIYFQDPAATNGPWRLEGDPFPNRDRGADVIPAGVGFIVRKAAGNGQPDFWTNNFPVQAATVVSRKTHGGAGDFDIPLPLSGTTGVECRNSGSNTHKVIFTFPTAVTFSGAAVTSGTATTVSPSAVSSSVVAVDLAGVTDVQSITVTLFNVSDGTNTNNVAVRMRVLQGDSNGSGNVSSTDIAQTKGAASVGTVSASTFRSDVNASGSINATDVAVVKSKSGGSVPDAAEESEGKMTARVEMQ